MLIFLSISNTFKLNKVNITILLHFKYIFKFRFWGKNQTDMKKQFWRVLSRITTSWTSVARRHCCYLSASLTPSNGCPNLLQLPSTYRWKTATFNGAKSLWLTGEKGDERPLLLLRPVPLRREAERRNLHVCCCCSSSSTLTVGSHDLRSALWLDEPLDVTGQQQPALPSRGRCRLVFILQWGSSCPHVKEDGGR